MTIDAGTSNDVVLASLDRELLPNPGSGNTVVMDSRSVRRCSPSIDAIRV